MDSFQVSFVYMYSLNYNFFSDAQSEEEVFVSIFSSVHCTALQSIAHSLKPAAIYSAGSLSWEILPKSNRSSSSSQNILIHTQERNIETLEHEKIETAGSLSSKNVLPPHKTSSTPKSTR